MRLNSLESSHGQLRFWQVQDIYLLTAGLKIQEASLGLKVDSNAGTKNLRTSNPPSLFILMIQWAR